MSRAVHRMTLPITDTIDEKIAGFRRAVYAAPARPELGNPDRNFELWYEVGEGIDEALHVRIHVEGTGHSIEHDGEFVSTMNTADGQLIWHVYVEYPVMSDV